jgi:hypothetical protein
MTCLLANFHKIYSVFLKENYRLTYSIALSNLKKTHFVVFKKNHREIEKQRYPKHTSSFNRLVLWDGQTCTQIFRSKSIRLKIQDLLPGNIHVYKSMDISDDINEERQCRNTAISSTRKDRINKTGNLWNDVILRRVRATIFAVEKQLTLRFPNVIVAFGIQHAMACAVFSSVACPALRCFSNLFHKRQDFRGGGTIVHKMCVLIFSTTLIENISHSEKNLASYNEKRILIFM